MTDFIKPFTLGDGYFPSSKKILKSTIADLFKDVSKDYNYSSRMIFVPHSAYNLSGKVTASAFQYLDRNIKNVFIIAPAHFLMFHGLYLSSFDKWQSPLGDVDVNKVLLKEINEKFDADYNNRAYENEHDIDVQIPFIQTLLPGTKIVPILFGNSNYTFLLHLLNTYWSNKENGFIFVHNLSHFYSESKIENVDDIIADEFEQGKSQFPDSGLKNKSMIAMIDFSIKNNYSLIRVGLGSSGEISGEYSEAVGYGAWFLAEESVISFIKNELSEVVLDICKNIIGSKLFNSELKNFHIPPILKSRGASFVEIFIDGEKRGEAGTFFAYQSFYDDLLQNAGKAAMSVKIPLKKDEFEKISLKIYLLSRPADIAFNTEECLLNQINPDEDGLIFQQGDNDIYIMPGRCRDFADKQEFIKDVSAKLGADKYLHSKLMHVFKFKTVKIESTDS